MTAVDGLRVLARRWVTCVAGLVLTAAGVLVVTDQVPPTYRATGEMLLILPPDATGVETPSNPYLNLGSGLTTTAALIGRMLSTDDMRDQLSEQGHDADYVITVVGDAGPLIELSVTGSSSAEALDTRDVLMGMVDDLLVSLQTEAAVPTTQVMRATRPTESRGVEVIRSATYRAMGVVIALGLLLTVLLCLIADWIGRTRRARREWSQTTGVAGRVTDAKAATAERLRLEDDETEVPQVDQVEEATETEDDRQPERLVEPDSRPAEVQRVLPVPAKRRPARSRQRAVKRAHDGSGTSPESLAG